MTPIPTKRLWLTAKISVLFALLLSTTLAGILALFMRVAGHDFIDELGRLRAMEGVFMAEDLERLTAEGHSLDSPEIRRFLHAEHQRLGFSLAIRPGPPPLTRDLRRHPWHPEYHTGTVQVRGRSCYVAQVPAGELWIPLRLASLEADSPESGSLEDDNLEAESFLIMRGPAHAEMIHEAFRRGLMVIAFFSLLGVLGLALYLAWPLRRLSRSMDRIADGDLDHRIHVSGRDEVADMGRSFNHMADRIQAMIRGQKELLAAVSHELRSPMARIKLHLELMRQSSRQTSRLDQVDAEIDFLDALVNELLHASRYELGAAELRPEVLDPLELAQTQWDRLTGGIDSQGTNRATAEVVPILTLDAEPEGLRICADRASTSKIFHNLLANARRYAPGPVTVRAWKDGDRVKLQVSDQGPGVSNEDLGRLFEPFFRADRSRVLGSGNVGLGLMVAQKAAQAHGGEITARHGSPTGLTIEFDLPLVSS